MGRSISKNVILWWSLGFAIPDLLMSPQRAASTAVSALYGSILLLCSVVLLLSFAYSFFFFLPLEDLLFIFLISLWPIEKRIEIFLTNDCRPAKPQPSILGGLSKYMKMWFITSRQMRHVVGGARLLYLLPSAATPVCRRPGAGRPMFDLLQSTVLSTRALGFFFLLLSGREGKKKERGAMQRDAYLRHVYVKMRSWSAALSSLSLSFFFLSRSSVTSEHLAKYAHTHTHQSAHTYLNTFVTRPLPT